MSRVYILKDYCMCSDDTIDPLIFKFKNKDEVIQQLLNWLGDDISYEVKG